MVTATKRGNVSRRPGKNMVSKSLRRVGANWEKVRQPKDGQRKKRDDMSGHRANRAAVYCSVSGRSIRCEKPPIKHTPLPFHPEASEESVRRNVVIVQLRARLLE